jgi:hypothetical protein
MTKYLPILILLLVAGCTCLRRTCYVGETNPNPPAPREIDRSTFIEIAVAGGGFYGGTNPTTEDRKVIHDDGTVLIRHNQLYSDGTETTLFVSRDEVEKLARFILDEGFFRLENLYDCDIADSECQKRKKRHPRPVPLDIDVTIGEARKRVTVAVYDQGMVIYPDNLESIVDKIDQTIRAVGE